MTLDEAITRYESNAEFERTHENLRGCQEFKMLAGWLKELKELKADPKNRIARERYEDLVGYFGGDETILESREEFQKWLARIKWHIKKCCELAREKEPEPCEDAISRKAAVVQLYHNKTGDDDIDVIIERDIATIQALPSVTPKQKWIPVSERLPEESANYIVTEKVYSIDDRKHKGRYNTKVEQVECCNGKWRKASFFEVVAWMPLPKPYKVEGEDKE